MMIAMPAIIPNSTALLPLSGTTDAARPSLGGEIIYDQVVSHDFPFAQGSGNVTANVQLRVVRSNATGLLDFYYRILAVHTFTTPVKFTVETQPVAGLKFTYADYRPDGVGTLRPVDFQLFAQDEVQNGVPVQLYHFFFNTGMKAGESTEFFFLSSNATQYSATACYLTNGVAGVISRCPGPTVV